MNQHDIGECIGKGYDNDGCGFKGRRSGDNCPNCGGMILSKKDQIEANKLAETIRKWENNDRNHQKS